MIVRALQCVRRLLSSGHVRAKGLSPLTRQNFNISQSSWLGKSPFLGLWSRQIRVSVVRRYCSTSGGDRDDEADEVEGEASDDIGVDLVAPPMPAEGTVAPISIPEVFPDVPVLIMNRNPLFPRFVKMVTDKALMALIRCKVKLSQPYAGAFLKRDDSNESEVISSLDEIYNVGTFVQIAELHDTGDKMRMIVQGHRRIKITGVVEPDKVESGEETKKKTKNNLLRRKKPSEPPLPTPTPAQDSRILMVATENVIHEPFEQTQEVKEKNHQMDMSGYSLRLAERRESTAVQMAGNGVEQPPPIHTPDSSHKKFVFRKIVKPAEASATSPTYSATPSANASCSVQKTITNFVTPTSLTPKSIPTICPPPARPPPPPAHPPPPPARPPPPPTFTPSPRNPSPLSFIHHIPASSPPLGTLNFSPTSQDRHPQPVSSATDKHPEPGLAICQSHPKPMTLGELRAQRLEVMDDICNVLSEISAQKFSELFGATADTMRKKLAKRKLLLSKESELQKHSQGSQNEVTHHHMQPPPPLTTSTSRAPPKHSDDIENFDEDDMIAAWSEIECGEKPNPQCNPPRQQAPILSHVQPTPRPSIPIATVPPLAVHPSTPSLSTSTTPPTSSRSLSSPSTSTTSSLFDQLLQGIKTNGAAEFRKSYPHSHEMMKLFTKVFGLRQFRMNQLEAMNASLLGHDCFVLMPTGGGKSLCYQLPALLQPGVTVVVSPLRSLIQDQVQKLQSLEVPAQQLCGDNPFNDTIYTLLAQRQPELKLLYVTPEKLGASNKLLSALQSLYTRGMLAQFVVDEAHCISQWGHDFRPDYKRLNELRVKFPSVPVMAVTATATPRVQADVVLQLRLRDTKWFTQSFNRPNLKFSVVPKRLKKVNEEIIKLINESFKGQSGIVYCLSRRDCEVVAGELLRAGIAALCYHAGLSDEERISVQQRWAQEDRCKVVCATIAFGMGIDKPDVRLVIHHSLPKSMEGYYQEAGRAGRDGRTATCVLYYNYADMSRIRRMIEVDGYNVHHKVDLDNLYRMVQYCENQTDCRRKQLLGYFAEKFDPLACKRSRAPCDNCVSTVPYHTQDVSEMAKKVIESVRSCHEQVTLVQCLDAIKGSASQKSARNRLSSLPLFGCGTNMVKHDIERMLHLMVLEGMLGENLQIGSHDNVVCYVQVGPKHGQVLDGSVKVMLPVKGKVHVEVAAGGGNQKRGAGEEDLMEECYQALLQLRGQVALTSRVQNPGHVFTTETLREMAQSLPSTEEDMMTIVGMTDVKWRNYKGEEFLKVTKEFARKAALESSESIYWKGRKNSGKKQKDPVAVIASDPYFSDDDDYYFVP